MWFAILALSLATFVLHAVYFSGRVAKAVTAVSPERPRWLSRARIAYLCVACSMPFILIGTMIYGAVSGAGMVQPESLIYDYLILFPFWLVTFASFQATLFIVPLDLVHFGLRKLGVLAEPKWIRARHMLVLGLVAVCALYVPLRTAIDARSLETDTHEVAIPDLPQELDGLEIALVADIQSDRYTQGGRVNRFINAINHSEPDLTLIAGDLINGPPGYIESAARAAGHLRARYGVLASVGDHDNFAYRDRDRSLREVKDALSRNGVPLGDNEVRRITVGEAEIAIVLATHNYVNRIGRDTITRLMKQAAGADLTIVVSHQANDELLAASREGGADLFLSGHTHGGQINFYTPFGNLSPAHVENRYIQGLYDLGTMKLVVTPGLGMSVTPFRYRSPAGFDLIRLRRAPPAD